MIRAVYLKKLRLSSRFHPVWVTLINQLGCFDFKENEKLMILYFLGGKPLPYSERNVDGLKTESEIITEDA